MENFFINIMKPINNIIKRTNINNPNLKVVTSILFNNLAFGVEEQISKDSEVKCRICQKTEKETTFNKKSHIIPEFMGNENICGLYECDACNLYFATLENDLKKFLSADLYQVKINNSKKDVTYFSQKKDAKTGIGKDKIAFSSDNNLFDNVTIDKKNKTVTEKFITEKYVPYDAFLGICKILLLIIPEDELKYFQYLVKLIKKEEVFTGNIVIKRKLLNIQEPFPFSFITIHEIHRKYIVTLALRNIIFEIKIPLFSTDSASITNQNSIYINENEDRYISLESKEITPKYEIELYFSYESFVENDDLTPEQKDILKGIIEKIHKGKTELKDSVDELGKDE